MARSFLYNVLTLDGAALIAQATSANPIAFVGALSSDSAASSDTDLATKDKAWYTGKTGEVRAVSATNSVAEIRAVFPPSGSQPQILRSACILAKLASQDDSEAVVLTALSDPASTIEIPAESGLAFAVEVPFDVAINAQGDVEATPGGCASLADLDRFVSLHKAGNPNAGENQTIKGEKTFEGLAKFTAITGISSDPIEIRASLKPDANDSYNIGDPTHTISRADINTIYTNTISSSGDIGFSANITPSAGSTINIGTASKIVDDGYFSALHITGNGYIGTVNTDNIQANVRSYIWLKSTLLPFSSSVDLGDDQTGFNSVYLSTQDGGGSIFNAPHPYKSGSSVLLRVGSNLMIVISYTTLLSSDVSFVAGDLIQVGQNNISEISVALVYTSSTGEVTYGKGHFLSGYLFRLLSDVIIRSGTAIGYAYAVCVGEA